MKKILNTLFPLVAMVAVSGGGNAADLEITTDLQQQMEAEYAGTNAALDTMGVKTVLPLVAMVAVSGGGHAADLEITTDLQQQV